MPGTYQYFWWAYGNGDDHLYNQSSTRYYTLNGTIDNIYPSFSNIINNTPINAIETLKLIVTYDKMLRNFKSINKAGKVAVIRML